MSRKHLYEELFLLMKPAFYKQFVPLSEGFRKPVFKSVIWLLPIVRVRRGHRLDSQQGRIHKHKAYDGRYGAFITFASQRGFPGIFPIKAIMERGIPGTAERRSGVMNTVGEGTR